MDTPLASMLPILLIFFIVFTTMNDDKEDTNQPPPQDGQTGPTAPQENKGTPDNPEV